MFPELYKGHSSACAGLEINAYQCEKYIVNECKQSLMFFFARMYSLSGLLIWFL
jgi:hypothetical protein